MIRDEGKILVTGGAGFIGSNLVRSLLKRFPDVQITVLDNFTYAGDWGNLPHRSEHQGRLDVIQADVCDAAAVGHAVTGADIVYHLAAETHVTRSIFDCSRFVHTDVIGTQVLLTAAISRKPSPLVIHVSTSEVYGSAQAGVMTEEHPLLPMSPYAAAKAGADRLVYSFMQTYGLPAVIVRPFNNYGPRQHLEKVLPRFITSAIDGEALRVHGDGAARRDFVFVDDTCSALIAIVEAPREKVVGQVLNVASGTDVSVAELARAVLDLVPTSRSSIEMTEERPGQVVRHTGDSTRIRELLGWEPVVSLSDGLFATFQWYVAQEEWWRKRWDAREFEIVLPDGRSVLH